MSRQPGGHRGPRWARPGVALAQGAGLLLVSGADIPVRGGCFLPGAGRGRGAVAGGLLRSRRSRRWRALVGRAWRMLLATS